MIGRVGRAELRTPEKLPSFIQQNKIQQVFIQEDNTLKCGTRPF